nr:hypothetical protein [Tanacetum cinerariifolium]GFA52639.1 hypothetical protein [Tanacetum cinerariifolium]
DEDVAEDTSNQGRKIDAIDQNPDISLVQHEAKVQGRHEQEIKFEIEDINTAKTLVRNKPMTQAQQRTYMSNYVKHMGSHTLKQLKKLSFDELKNLCEATMKRVKTFTPMKSDVDRTILKIADDSAKRAAEEELEQESSKRQKIGESSKPREKKDDELTQEDLQQMMMMVPVEEVYVEAI